MSESPRCPTCGGSMTLQETGVLRRPGASDYLKLEYACTTEGCPGRATVDERDASG